MYDDRPSPIATGLLLLLAWLSVYIVAPVLASFWDIGAPPGWVLGGLTLYATLCALRPWLYTLLIPAAGAALYWLSWLREGLYLDYTVWYTDLRLGYWPAPPGTLAWAAMGLALLGLSLLFVREPLRRGKALWSFILGTALFGHMWLWGDDLAAPRYLLFLLAVIPLWATGAAVAREDRWWRAGRRVVEGTHWAASLVLGLLVAGAAGWLLPAPAALDLGPASAWLRQTFPAMANMRGPQSQAETDPQGFNLAAAGFARRLTELGGPVRPVDDVAMRLTLLSGTVEETLYLRGTAMTNYTGRGWAQETRPGSVGDDVPPMGQELTLEMTPVGISGNTIFYPREIMAVRGIDAYQFGRESYLFSRERLMQPYQVQAYRPAGRPAASMPLMFDPGRYLALPGDLPARVRHLAADLTSSQPTPYDEALAIEAYLRNLPYDMGVPATPPGRDFVDYFLFDLRRGYCTYSATAMVVMLRSESIPARWVQGFAAVPGETEVRWSSAHAWVEAYFPGYGWAVFDPTPRFTLPARLSQEQAGAAVSILEPGPGVEEPSVSTVPPSPEATSAEGRFPWWLGAVVLVALAYAATSVQAFYKERIDWRDERAGLVQAFTLLASALGRMGLPRLSHQTPAEYAGDVAGAWPELGPAVRQVAADVTAALYARPGAPLPDGARRRMGGTMAALWDRARGRWGIVRTAWIRFRYLWGKD